MAADRQDTTHTTGEEVPVIVHHDKETFSEADLKACGAYGYARHPSTDCLLTSGVVDWPARTAGSSRERETHTRRWRPGDAYPYPDIHPDDIEVHAWNSQFERLIWNGVMVPRYGWPRLALEQFVCVSAQARMMAAGPAKLDKAGPFFRRPVRKDNNGHLLMLKMCRPATEAQQLRAVEHDGQTFAAAKRCHHTREAIDRLHDYCDVDVWTETGIGDILPPWHPDDLEAFHENERINDQGIIVDVEFASRAMSYAEEEKAWFSEQIARLTDGVVTTPRQFDRIKKWLLPRLSPAALDIARWYDNGLEKYSFDADTRANLLAEVAADADLMDESAAELIELMDAAGKSAIAKYEAILNRAIQGKDGLWRVHGCYILAGASQSTRFSSTGIQVHNLVRDVPKNTVPLITAFKREDETAIRRECAAWADAHNARVKDGQRRATPEPIHVLARTVRPTITGCPRGRFDLVWCDWSSIELCTNPWLSLDPDADDILAMLRRGEDVYLKTASDITGRRITKDDEFERQAFGKVPNLSLGYLGGAGAFKAMAKNYGVRLDDETVNRTVKAWREANPWAMRFGEKAEQAAMMAIERPGVSYGAGRLQYLYDGDMLDGMGALVCILPSGKELVYPDARIDIVTTKYGKDLPCVTAIKSAWNPKKGEDKWPRVAVWKGLMIENASQAVATGEILRLGLKRCRDAGLTVCAHTHDEIMILSDDPMRDGPRLEALMTQRPDWPGADLLPLRAEWGAGYRYKVKGDYSATENAA